MTPERWQQVSRIFKSAISLDGEKRAAYLAGQCGVDESLRAEVEKLLESHRDANAENFINGVAAERAASLLIDDEEIAAKQQTLNKGQQFGSYLILDFLGAGGMGEVYLARDSRLDRTVALKVLSQDISQDKRRMQRFRQEAKVASSLNQPNILTVYEFGEVDGLTFLATEFIDGETLRDYLRGKRLKLAEVFDIAIQVLGALDAAHEARIVHRDIKPENVMIRRRDHVVKVLDFGLAKVTEKRPSAIKGDESEAATEFKTTPGSIMGTINYMSPEQAQARALDERTDIWSTGVMIYEMVSGLMPFKGATDSHTIVQILEKDPVPLTQFTQRKSPEELQRIVSKALSKSLDERYQTAKDILIDLRNLKKRLDVEAEIERTLSPSAPVAAVATDEFERGPQKKRMLAIALIAMGVVTAGFVGVSVWRAWRARTNAPVATAPPVVSEQRKLTYWITVQKYRNGQPYQDPFQLSRPVIFESDYLIRLHVRSEQDGYLYVLNEGPEQSGKREFVLAFPSSKSYWGSALLRSGKEAQIPENSWLKFDKEQGVEKLWFIFSANEIEELNRLKAYSNEKAAGFVSREDDVNAIQRILHDYGAVEPSPKEGEHETTVTGQGEVLVFSLNLEHH